MKKIFYLLTVLFIITQFTATAQKSGVITYERTVNVHDALTGFQKALKVFLPKEKTSKIKVTFNENYAKVETVLEESESLISVSYADAPVYLDLKNKTKIDLLEFEDAYYAAKIPMEIPTEEPVKGKTKRILDYDCVAYEKGNARKASVLIAPCLPKGLSPMGEHFF